MTTGFDHIHVTDGHEQSCFIEMFENEVWRDLLRKCQVKEITIKDLFSGHFLVSCARLCLLLTNVAGSVLVVFGMTVRCP